MPYIQTIFKSTFWGIHDNRVGKGVHPGSLTLVAAPLRGTNPRLEPLSSDEEWTNISTRMMDGILQILDDCSSTIAVFPFQKGNTTMNSEGPTFFV